MFQETTPNTWTCELGAYTAMVHMFSPKKFVAVIKEGDNSRIVGDYKSYAEAEATVLTAIRMECYQVIDRIDQYRQEKGV